MKVLQITVHYSPNVGGVETHLDDLVSALIERKNDVFVLSYRPLTSRVSWKIFENCGKLKILRIPWIPGLFYRFVKKPLLEFIYLFPGLFIFTPFVIALTNPDIIHSHGIVAGFIGTFWGKVLNKKVILSTHSIYQFPEKGFYREFVIAIFRRIDLILTLSKQSAQEITDLGISYKKVKTFTYWINLDRFKPISDAKRKVGWQKKFVVLFVGRLVEEKGVLILMKAAKMWNSNITLAVAGTGPLENEIRKVENETKNLIYLGKVNNENLPKYYSASDLVIVPSIHEEGFGRVILESLACGTPVVAANRGAIPEAVNKTVGVLIEVNTENIKNEVEYFYKTPVKLKELSRNARGFAVKRYSEENVSKIIELYKK